MQDKNQTLLAAIVIATISVLSLIYVIQKNVEFIGPILVGVI